MKRQKSIFSSTATQIAGITILSIGAFAAVTLVSPDQPAPTITESNIQAVSNSQSVQTTSLIDQKAPDFTLLDQDGTTVSLADYRGKSLVIFFNEGEMCYPSCWNQITSLGTNPKLNNDKVATLSMVIDTRQQWDMPFEKKPEMMTETILFDSSKDVSKAYDMLNFPSSMHPGDRPGHSYVVIDSSGIIRKIKDDPDMGINDPWLEQVVEEIQL